MERILRSSSGSLLFLLVFLVLIVGCGGGSGGGGQSHESPNSDLAASFNGGGCYPQGANSGLPSPFDQLTQIVLVNPEWAPLVNGQVIDSEPVVIHGTVLRIHGDTGGDYPVTHVQSDVVTTVQPDEEDARRLATGNLEGEGGEMEFEWEHGAYPDWAWAGVGDRIVGLGRWIFDCGHPDSEPGRCSATSTQSCILDSDCRPPVCPTCAAGEACTGQHFGYTSEMHPPQATAVIREGRGGIVSDEPGAATVAATRADVFVGADGGGAGDRCVLTHQASLEDILFRTNCYPLKEPVAPVNGRDFTFDLPLPPEPRAGSEASWRLVKRALPDGGITAAVEVKSRSGASKPHLEVSVKMTEPVGGSMPTGFGATIFAGWKDAPAALIHVRVIVEGVAISNALKPAKPIGREDRSWHLQAAVNGEWQDLAGLDDVATGEVVPQNRVFDQYLPSDATLGIFSNGTSRVCIDTMFGKALITDILELGPIDTVNCLLTTDAKHDPGDVDVTYAGPDFGAGQGGEASYETASRGADGGTCSSSIGAVCITGDDCPQGESCVPTGTAYTLRYRIQRLP